MPRQTGYTVYKNRRLLTAEELEILDVQWLAGISLMEIAELTRISQKTLKLNLVILGHEYEPRRWDETNRGRTWTQEKKSAYDKERRALARLNVLEHYGPQCNCCGEDNILFLSIDHINNDGSEDRKKTQTSMWEAVVKRNFPDTLQILCMNCNWGKRMNNNTICPHTEPQWIYSKAGE
jgi:hypothetical protein